MEKPYKYEKYITPCYNITSKLVDENVAGGRGEKIAIYYRDKTYRYREIQAYINKVGNALHILGVHQDGRVMLVMKDTPEAVASFYGAIKIGAIPIFVNYMYTADDFRYLLNDSRARTLIVDEEFIETAEVWQEKRHYLKTTVVVGKPHQASHLSFHDIVDRCSDKLEVAYTTVDDAAFWNYTSGSTGVPKGAVHLQHDIFTCIDNYAIGTLGLTSNDILLSASKLFFAYGLGNTIFYPFGVGGATVLLPERPLPETIFATINKYRPTVFCGVPTLYASLLQVADAEKNYDLSSLRICTSAGEALPKEIFSAWKERFGLEILDGIGSTEILHIFISNRPGDVRPGSSGKLIHGYAARIIDENGHDVPDGEVGTLHIKGDSTAAFYWRHHDKTKSSMLGEWFNTGDQYYRDENGYYYYCGRGDDMLKVGGIWVSPIEVEEALLSHPAVFQTAVVAKNDANKLVKPKAFVVLKKGYEPSEALGKEIQLFVKQSIAPYKFPRWIEFVSALPMTETGKIQRYKLRGR
jgi:benzoate-CoA ligase family protein